MTRSAIALVALALLNAVLAANMCDGITSCKQCASVQGCGWCAASMKCLAGNQHEPTEANTHCLGRGAWNYGTCPDCDSFSNDCRLCTEGNFDCAWCKKTNKCVEWDDETACPAGPQQHCSCDQYKSCATCTAFGDTACGWCTESDSCVETGDTTQTCLLKLTCPCEDNKNCDTCLDDFNGHHKNGCAWCADTATCHNRGQATCATASLSCPAACSSYTGQGCEACQDAGCGWCGSTKQCVDLGADECPLVAHTCPEKHCGVFNSCDTCNQRADAGCGWCHDKASGKKSCLNIGGNETCSGLVQHSCDAECKAQTSCADCSAVTGCGWCEQNEKRVCMDLNIEQGQCLHQLVCGAEESSGGKTGTFFLGMFVMALILGVIGGGYVFWQRRQGRPLYTSI